MSNLQSPDNAQKTVMDFYAYCCERKNFDDFITLFAMYCNHYIKWGFSCLTEDTEETMFGLKKSDFVDSEEETLLPYLEKIYNGIKTQDYTFFEEAVAINSEFSVAHLYLFVSKAILYFYFLEYADTVPEWLWNSVFSDIRILNKVSSFIKDRYTNKKLNDECVDWASVNNCLKEFPKLPKEFNLSEIQEIQDSVAQYIQDASKCAMNFYESCRKEKKIDTFILFFMLYCEILHGDYGYLYDEYENDDVKKILTSCFLDEKNERMFGLEKDDFADSKEKTLLPCLEGIYYGITFPVLRNWYTKYTEEIPEEQLIAIIDKSRQEQKAIKDFLTSEYYSHMMKHYSQLSSSYQEYALSSGKYYDCIRMAVPGAIGRDYNSENFNLSLLPHLFFTSITDKWAEKIITDSKAFNKEIEQFIKDIDLSESERDKLESGYCKLETGENLTEEEETAYYHVVHSNPDYANKYRKFEINLFKSVENLEKSIQGIPALYEFSSLSALKSPDISIRMRYLHLYNMIRFGNGQKTFQNLLKTFQNLFETNVHLEQKNQALKQAQEEKTTIINDFSHTYSNMRATTLQTIAEDLFSIDDEEFTKWGRKLLVEYSIKENLSKTVELLQLQIEDNISDILEKIRGTVDKDTQNSLDTAGLVSDALQRCFMSLLYDESESNKGKCKLFFGMENYEDCKEEREKLQESFEEHILTGTDDIFLWLTETNAIHLDLTISGEWSKLHFQKDGYAAIQLTNWLSELLMNIFKYADKSSPISLCFSQKEAILFIRIHNYRDAFAKDFHGSRNGIKAMSRAIQRLNSAVGYIENPLHIDQSDAEYQLEIKIASEILKERNISENG